MSEQKIVAGFGEVMLRLAPAGKLRFSQILPGTMEATYGGGEANVCASIAIMGGKSRYLTALPKNILSASFAAEQRGFGTDVERIRYADKGRMGVYYAEQGAAQRGSNVTYDREFSTISMLAPEEYDFDYMLDGVSHLHVTGITPALSENAYLSTLAIVKKASEKGIRVSCDLNFRKKLWKWGGVPAKELACRCMKEIVAYADVIIGNEADASDVFGIASEGSSVEDGKINIKGYGEVARKLCAAFPKASLVAITLRESYSADHNNWGGMLYEKATDTEFFAPLAADGTYKPYEIKNIVDRIGGGDSFSAGLIFALVSDEFNKPADAIRYAVAASCLKHSIHGDYNHTTKDEVSSRYPKISVPWLVY